MSTMHLEGVGRMSVGYTAFGLGIDSEIAVPGALRAGEGEESQIHIRRGDADVGEVLREDGPYTLGRKGLLFQKADVARYLISAAGDSIVVQAFADAVESDVAGFLIATALPAALWLRGRLVLHAAAVVVPGSKGAVAVMGRSGSGKSTLLQRLVQQGSAVVAEDSASVRSEGHSHLVSGLPQTLWLRSAGADLQASRRAVEVPRAQCMDEAPLRAIVVLDDAVDGNVPELRRLDVPHAIETVLSHRHRPKVPSLLHMEGVSLGAVAAVVRDVPVYAWRSAGLDAVALSDALHFLSESAGTTARQSLAG